MQTRSLPDCFKGGSFFPRVHDPRHPNSAARQYSAFAEQLLACFAPARADIPMSLALSLLIIFYSPSLLNRARRQIQ